MAEERSQQTEDPTPRRQQKAREEGQVASSKELTAALQFAAAVMMLSASAAGVFAGLVAMLRGFLQLAFRDEVGLGRLMGLSKDLLTGPLSFIWGFGAVLMAIGLLSHLAQTGFAFTVQRLQPDLQRLNPMKKLQQLPQENLGQAAKSLLLLPLAGTVFYYVVRREMETFLALPRFGLEAGSAVVFEAIRSLLSQASVALVALGAYDLWRQRKQLFDRLKMSKQEVRQEFKDLEGDPQIKARLRRMQREMMRKRMMADVPKATVVITNPTHYAVAIRYAPEENPAPVVLAKGVDHLALRIRKVADEHEIPLVENPPLAQALYKGADVGQQIPIELYRAVAEILAYIYRMRERG
ncbi:MAG: flagellar biosynthesis protein FlhB [Acidobacteria bacterium]|nr:flagellar biosynthesis protein FlhB [Acidobacteriota bacterium]